MRKRELLKRLHIVIKILIFISKIFPKYFHRFNLRFTRNWDGYIGILIRYICLKNLCKTCGDNIAVFSGVYIIRPENLELGSNISIHPMCYLDSTGGILIGSDVSIAHGTTIMSTEHNFDDLNRNIKDQGCKSIKTIIDCNVWIGAGCRILAGSTINKGSIIAAGAVVKNTVQRFCVYGGVPAKLIKER